MGLGLDSESCAEYLDVETSVADCAMAMYQQTHLITNGGQYLPASCSQQGLFDDYLTIEACVNELCAPRTLNPDISGVGVGDALSNSPLNVDVPNSQVYMSLIMQSAIAVSAASAILHQRKWPFARGERSEAYIQALVVASVEFQQNQCYFAGATQIATLVFVAGQLKKSSTFDIFDDDFLYTLSTNGFIPVVFTLTSISRYGRQTWYIVLLSLAVFALSTASITTSAKIWLHADTVDLNLAFGAHTSDPLPLYAFFESHVNDILKAWCGTDQGLQSSIFDKAAVSSWVFLLWVHSLL